MAVKSETTLPLTTRLRKFAFHSDADAASLITEAADRIDELTVKLEHLAGKEMRRVR
jgi:hypothetical protein